MEIAKVSKKKELKHLDMKADKKAMKEFESFEELKGLMEKAVKDFKKTMEFKNMVQYSRVQYYTLDLMKLYC